MDQQQSDFSHVNEALCYQAEGRKEKCGQ